MLRGCEGIPSHIKNLAGAETLAEAWQTCEDGHELIRLCGAMIGTEGWPTKQEILLVLCDCAEKVLPYLPKEEASSRECIRVSRLWADGEATVEQIKRVVELAACDSRVSPISPAYSAAYAAFCAAEADAHAAAGRADAASGSSFKFMCVTNAVPFFAAHVLADAAGAHGSVVWRNARSESLKKTADFVRSRLHPTAWEI